MLTELIDPPVLSPEPFDIDRVVQHLVDGEVACVTGLFSDELLDGLSHEVRALDSSDELTAAGIGRNDDYQFQSTVRNDRTCWIEGETSVEEKFLAVLEELRLAVNERLMLGIFDVEAHYAVYEPGAFYQKHYDSFKGARNRLLTLVLYLNKDWHPEDGGQLLVFNEEQGSQAIAAVLPDWGHTVIFLSEDVPHEVRQTQRSRYSIACWYRCNQPL